MLEHRTRNLEVLGLCFRFTTALLLVNTQEKVALSQHDRKKMLTGTVNLSMNQTKKADILLKYFLFNFTDVITIEKTGENFRLLYDVKGRFTIHRIKPEEAKVRKKPLLERIWYLIPYMKKTTICIHAKTKALITFGRSAPLFTLHRYCNLLFESKISSF